jgi:hypothetical protein
MAHDDEQIRDTLVEPSLPPPLSPNVARGVIHRLLELEKVCQQARRQLLDDPITPQVAQDLFDKLLDATGAVRAELYDVLQRGGEDEEPDVFLEAFEHSTPNPPADHPITSFPKAAAVLDGLSNYCDPRYPELRKRRREALRDADCRSHDGNAHTKGREEIGGFTGSARLRERRRDQG